MEEKKIINENELQDLCGKFVGREVYCCLTSEIEYILKKSWDDSDALYSYENDDIENLYYYRIEGIDLSGLNLSVVSNAELKKNIEEMENYADDYSEEDKDTLISEIDNYIDEMSNEMDDYDNLLDEPINDFTHERNTKQIEAIRTKLDDYKTEVENAESEMQEIFEWWAVSSWFADKLIAAGHPVIKNNYGVDLWGRCTTGQAILLDGIVRTLTKERYDVEGN